MQCVTYNTRHIGVLFMYYKFHMCNVFCLPKGGMLYVSYNTRHFCVLFMYYKFHLCKYLVHVLCGTTFVIGVDYYHGTCHVCLVINM